LDSSEEFAYNHWVLVFINRATYAPSAAASAARRDDEGDASEHRRGGATTQTRARSDPRESAGRRSGSRPAGARRAGGLVHHLLCERKRLARQQTWPYL